MKTKFTAVLIVVSFVFGSALSTAANNRDREMRVVTYNMYLGTDFTEIFSAESFPEVIAEVAEAYGDVVAGNPVERIDEIADQIASTNAVVVGLQEVALWRLGAFNDPAPATAVSYDFLQMLIDELADRGLHYNAVAVQYNFEAELPGASATFASDVRYTDRDVILVRSDLQTSEVKIEGSAAGTFTTLLTLPTIIGPVTVQRGWTSVDIKFRGKTYRVVNAHTEAYLELVQIAQTAELIQGPAATEMPLVVVGDFNSDAESGGASYQMFIAAGLDDAWEETNPADPGLSWPLFIVSPAVFTTPTQRLDLVMTRGNLRTVSTDLIGEDPVLDTTSSNLRPSDHAGVSARLVLGR